MCTLACFLEHNERLLVSRLGVQRYGELRRAAAQVFGALQSEAPSFKQAFNRQSFSYGVPCLAIYRALTETLEVPGPVSLDIVRDIVDRAARRHIESSIATRLMLRSLARSRLAAWLYMRSMSSLREPKGWRIAVTNDDAHIAFEVRQCGLALFLAEQGAAELCSVFCHADLVAAEYMVGLELDRRGTLAEGADACDFSYRLRRTTTGPAREGMKLAGA